MGMVKPDCRELNLGIEGRNEGYWRRFFGKYVSAHIFYSSLRGIRPKAGTEPLGNTAQLDEQSPLPAGYTWSKHLYPSYLKHNFMTSFLVWPDCEYLKGRHYDFYYSSRNPVSKRLRYVSKSRIWEILER